MPDISIKRKEITMNAIAAYKLLRLNHDGDEEAWDQLGDLIEDTPGEFVGIIQGMSNLLMFTLVELAEMLQLPGDAQERHDEALRLVAQGIMMNTPEDPSDTGA